ncbi:hypothetical protein LCGC14_1650980 [marine sediment metagenome]|uniref:4Fe-4S domain-containing protein n=1 Tax=marine sediment metagenome TaxID=412755 RepID=A0A0F9IJB0_9ZZZZ
MIEIYKKLPGTNCGKCGEPTCMAFALKVKNAQRKMSDCPYVTEADEGSFSQKPTVTMDDNYERVSNKLEEEVRNTNFKEAAIAIGGHYEIKNGGEIVRFKMMNKTYEVRKEGLFENNKYCHDSWSKIIVYDYVRRKGTRPLTGDWFTLGHFPDTASHVKAFQSKAEDKVAESFNKNMDGMKLRCKELRGSEESGKVKADYVCRFDLLPRIPLYLCFWEADEEFQASCKLFLDSSADVYIDIEYLAYLVERFVELFVK